MCAGSRSTADRQRLPDAGGVRGADWHLGRARSGYALAPVAPPADPLTLAELPAYAALVEALLTVDRELCTLQAVPYS